LTRCTKEGQILTKKGRMAGRWPSSRHDSTANRFRSPWTVSILWDSAWV